MTGAVQSAADDDTDQVELSDVEHAAAAARRTDRKVRELAERAERLVADTEMIRLLRADGFVGADYEVLVNRLSAYGIAVMEVWIPSGKAFTMTSKYKWRVEVTDSERLLLDRDFDVVNVLASDAVRTTLDRFRRDALLGGGWDPTKGASLSTYFLGAVIQSFPNVLRAWRTSHQHVPMVVELEMTDRQGESDPARIFTEEADFESLINRLSDRQRTVVGMTDQQFSQKEIAEHLKAEARSAEGVLYRLRKQLRDEGCEA